MAKKEAILQIKVTKGMTRFYDEARRKFLNDKEERFLLSESMREMKADPTRQRLSVKSRMMNEEMKRKQTGSSFQTEQEKFKVSGEWFHEFQKI